MPRPRLSAYTAPPAAVVAALDALRERHQVAEAFPAAALAEAEAACRDWRTGGPERFVARGHGDGLPVRDARDLPLVTIDPPGSQDLDQALLLQRSGPQDADGGYRLLYAIASPTTFITPGGALDTELRRRGETVYAPDRACPLHPESLSHSVASLLPGADRPSYLWSIGLDATGAVTSAHVERALVRSRARLSYAQVQDAVDGASCLPAPVPQDLPELLSEVGRLREQQEVLRGGVSLSVPEQEVRRVPVGGADGAEAAYRLAYRAALPVERWNAQVSLLTGMCAARIMVQAGVGVLRTMAPAEPDDHRRLRRVARALGVDWPEDLSYAGLVRRLDPAVSAHLAFMDQAAGLFRGAGYLAFGPGCGPTPTARQEAVHSAIAARYAHVTAPLRRLVDRYGEEVCVAACAGAPVPGWVLDALPCLPGAMAQAGRRSRAVERGAVSAVEALVLAGHVGEVFDGVLLCGHEGRGEVMLTEPAVVAAVRVEDGTQDPAAPGMPVGEAVRVRLVEADVASARTSFTLVR